MNIYVCVKQVPDTEAKIKLTADAQGIDFSEIKWIASPYDEFAIEEAIRIKEKNAGSLVTVLSVGPSRVVDLLRMGLALGADHAIHIDAPDSLDSFLVAHCLSEVLKKEPQVDLILTGKEAIDDGAAQVGLLLAENLGIPSITVVNQIQYGADGILQCKREIEGGAMEVIEAKLPLLLGTQKGLNEPRYASIPKIMQAKKKEIRTFKWTELGCSQGGQKIRYKNYQLPAQKQAGKKLQGEAAVQAKELVRLLREEAKVV